MTVISQPGPSAHTPSPQPSNDYGNPAQDSSRAAEARLCSQMNALLITPSFVQRFPPFDEHTFILLRSTLAHPERNIPIVNEVLQANADKIVEFVRNNWVSLIGEACKEQGIFASFPKSVTKLPYTFRCRLGSSDEINIYISLGQFEQGSEKVIKGVISVKKSSLEKLVQLSTRKWIKTSPKEDRMRIRMDEIRKGNNDLQNEMNHVRYLARSGVPNLLSYLPIQYRSKNKKLETRYVTEWCPIDLHTALVNTVKSSFEAQIMIAKSIAQTLEKIHALKIVYLDLKPQNILIRENGSICLTDFGFAVPENTMVIPRGSPGYFAPEIVEGSRYVASPAADMWSYGSLLYTVFYLDNVFYDDHNNFIFASFEHDRTGAKEKIKQTIRKTILEILNQCKTKSSQGSRPKPPIPLMLMIAELLSENPQDRKTASQVMDVLRIL